IYRPVPLEPRNSVQWSAAAAAQSAMRINRHANAHGAAWRDLDSIIKSFPCLGRVGPALLRLPGRSDPSSRAASHTGGIGSELGCFSDKEPVVAGTGHRGIS